MMVPTIPAVGGGSGGADLGPLTARVGALEAFGVEVSIPTIALAKSTPKAGTGSSTIGELFPGFPTEANFLLVAPGFPSSTVTVRAADMIAAVPASVFNPLVIVSLASAEGLVQVVIAAREQTATFEIVGDAADRMGLSGSYAPGSQTVRRIASGHAVDHAASQQSVGDALIAAQAKLAQIKLGQTKIRIPEDVGSLFSAMYQLGGAVSGATVQVVLNQRNTIDNIIVEGNLSGVELIAGPALYPVYLGGGLAVAKSGGRGGWVVTVSGIEPYVDLAQVLPGDRIEFAAQYGTPFTGAATEELAGEWSVTSVDTTARAITFEVTDIRNLTATTSTLVATVIRCRISGYPSPYHTAVVDIRPGGSLGGIGGISIVAPSGYSTSAMIVSGHYLGTTAWSSSYDTLRCSGAFAAGLDVRPGGSAYSKRLIVSGYNAGVSAKGPVTTEEATLSAGGGADSAGLLLGIGGGFTTKPGFLSIRGARKGVSTVSAVDLTASAGIVGNGDPGDPQVFATDGGRATVTGTTYTTSPAPNAMSADGSYIKRA